MGIVSLQSKGLAMSQETTDNFFAAWGVNQADPAPVFFRLYYNEQGLPLYYSMEDLPGNYVEIDQDFYSRSPTNVRVLDGKLHILIQKHITPKLVPNQDHGVACSPQDVCIIVADDQPHIKWSLKTNETTT